MHSSTTQDVYILCCNNFTCKDTAPCINKSCRRMYEYESKDTRLEFVYSFQISC